MTQTLPCVEFYSCLVIKVFKNILEGCNWKSCCSVVKTDYTEI